MLRGFSKGLPHRLPRKPISNAILPCMFNNSFHKNIVSQLVSSLPFGYSFSTPIVLLHPHLFFCFFYSLRCCLSDSGWKTVFLRSPLNSETWHKMRPLLYVPLNTPEMQMLRADITSCYPHSFSGIIHKFPWLPYDMHHSCFALLQAAPAARWVTRKSILQDTCRAAT